MFQTFYAEIQDTVRSLHNSHPLLCIKYFVDDAFWGQDLCWKAPHVENNGNLVVVKYNFFEHGVKDLLIFPSAPENTWWYYYWKMPNSENIKVLWELFGYELIVAYSTYILCGIWFIFFILIGFVSKERNRLIAIIFLLISSILFYLYVYALMHFSSLGLFFKYSGIKDIEQPDFTIMTSPKPMRLKQYHMVIEMGDNKVDAILKKIKEPFNFDLTQEQKKNFKTEKPCVSTIDKNIPLLDFSNREKFTILKNTKNVKYGFESYIPVNTHIVNIWPKKLSNINIYKGLTPYHTRNLSRTKIIDAEKLIIHLNHRASLNATLWLTWRAYALEGSLVSNSKTILLMLTAISGILCTLLNIPSLYTKWNSKRVELWLTLKTRNQIKRKKLYAFRYIYETFKEYGGPGLLEIKSLEPDRFQKKLYPFKGWKDTISWTFWKKNVNASFYSRVPTTPIWIIGVAGVLLAESRSTNSKIMVMFILLVWGAWYYCIRHLEGPYITNIGDKLFLSTANTFVFFLWALSSGKSFYFFGSSKYIYLSLLLVFIITFALSGFQKKSSVTLLKYFLFVLSITALLNNGLKISNNLNDSDFFIHTALYLNTDLLSAIWLWSYVAVWYLFYTRKAVQGYVFYILILLPLAYLVYNEISMFCQLNSNKYLLVLICFESLRLLYFFEKSAKILIVIEKKLVYQSKKITASQTQFVLVFLTSAFLLWINFSILSNNILYSNLLGFHILFIVISFLIFLITKVVSSYAARGGVEALYGAMKSLRYAKKLYSLTTLLLFAFVILYFIFYIYFIF